MQESDEKLNYKKEQIIYRMRRPAPDAKKMDESKEFLNDIHWLRYQKSASFEKLEFGKLWRQIFDEMMHTKGIPYCTDMRSGIIMKN